MALVSISEAARLTGRDRKTIYRYVDKGQLSLSQSVAGLKCVETSELIRVFGDLSVKKDSVDNLGHEVNRGKKGQHATPENSKMPQVAHMEEPSKSLDALEAEILGLRALLESKDVVIESKEAVIAVQSSHIKSLEDTVQSTMRLLEHNKGQVVTYRAWWKFWV